MIDFILNIMNQEPQRTAKTKDGLCERKAMNANNDRPLVQMDRTNEWSDYTTIPGAKAPKDQ
ncbi:MAG: hypothetical protein LPD71_00120 [Shewanella sp.]|nr:hypothetical protein [Shewanella sp.]MCF1437207.1 hypothetical protein [Shewanella sp.]MCF1459479.1 hypothetical protein [Shewanella sp.]